MAILLNTPITGTERCPIPECSSTHCEKGQSGGRTCSACNVWFDLSPTKRKSFSNVASIIEPSDYGWLAYDLLSVSTSSAYIVKSKLYQLDDTDAYRRIKLSTEDRIWDDEESLESALHDGLCIFNAAGKVAFTKLLRKYHRGRLSAEGLRTGVEELLEGMDSKITPKLTIQEGPEQMLDAVMLVISCSPPLS